MVQAPVLSSSASEREHASPGLEAARPLRLLVLVSKPKGIAPNQRFRIEQWQPLLAADQGIDLELVPFESSRLSVVLNRPGRRLEKGVLVLYDFLRRLKSIASSRQYDGVLVVREAALIGPAVYERLIRIAGVPMFFDFDDAIWHHNQVSSENGIFAKLHFYSKTATICRLATAVLAGNEYLASYARKQRTQSDNVDDNTVFVIPTSIDLDRYPVQPELPDTAPFTVSWSGSNSTLQHFEHTREALERLAKRRPLVVKVICNQPLARPIAGAENIYVPWSEAGEAEAVGATHVGIMPLPDTEFTRGKCGLKALQFMATGRPVVISPVGMNKDLVTSGQNGFLASTMDEWVDVLDKLASSGELRRRIGNAGRKTIEQGYSAAVVSKLFAKAVRQSLANVAARHSPTDFGQQNGARVS